MRKPKIIESMGLATQNASDLQIITDRYEGLQARAAMLAVDYNAAVKEATGYIQEPAADPIDLAAVVAIPQVEGIVEMFAHLGKGDHDRQTAFRADLRDTDFRLYEARTRLDEIHARINTSIKAMQQLQELPADEETMDAMRALLSASVLDEGIGYGRAIAEVADLIARAA